MWNPGSAALGAILAASLCAMPYSPAHAVQGGQTTAGGMQIHYSVMPAAAIAAYPEKSPERLMHGGPPRGPGQNHVMVALYDAHTSQRIEDADVRARVAELAMTGQERKLETMSMGGNVTYGNYFKLTGKGPYRITVSIHRRGMPGVTQASFDYAP
jgi:hypothetical protein